MEIMIKKLKEEVFFLRQKLEEIVQGSVDPSLLRLDNLQNEADGSDPVVEIQDLEGENADQQDRNQIEISATDDASNLNGADGSSSA